MTKTMHMSIARLSWKVFQKPRMCHLTDLVFCILKDKPDFFSLRLSRFPQLYVQLRKKDSTKCYFWTKNTLIRGGVGETVIDPPTWKTDIFFLRSLAALYYITKSFSKFETLPFTSFWLEISINWLTKCQRPKKKCIYFSRGRIYPCSAHSFFN